LLALTLPGHPDAIVLVLERDMSLLITLY
jgi:hypothetical protein